MRKLITSIVVLLFVGNAFGQTYEIAGLWYDSLFNVHFVTVDNMTGQMTYLDSLPKSVGGALYGKSLIKVDSNQFFFAGFDTASIGYYYTVDISTGSLISSVPDTNATNLLEVDPSSGTIYGIFSEGFPAVSYFGMLDAQNGQVTALNNLPSTLANAATFNSKTDQFIFIGKTNQLGAWRIYTVNASTGTLITDTLAQSWFYMIEVDTADGTVYGLRNDGSTYYFISIDPQSGLSTDISTLADLEAIYTGTAVFNSATRQFIFEGINFGDLAGDVHYYTIDALTGAVNDALSSFFVRTTALYKNTNVSITEHGLREGVGVYPNPLGNDVLNVTYELATRKNVGFSVVDFIGKQIIAIDKGSLAFGKHQESINIDQLSPGFYFLTVTIGEELYTTKVIKL